MKLALFVLALTISGCAHPCGYVDMRATINPVADVQARVVRTPAEHPLRILQEPAPDNAVLEVRLEETEVTEQPANREVYGRRAYVPYAWYTPLLKPLFAVTVVGPLYASFQDPHAHAGGRWRRLDYFRDVLAWFNLFSALPTGPRKITAEELIVRSEPTALRLNERSAPIPGRIVALDLDGREICRAATDQEGRVRFDLAPHLKPEMASSDHTLRIACVAPDEIEAFLTLDGKRIEAILAANAPR